MFSLKTYHMQDKHTRKSLKVEKGEVTSLATVQVSEKADIVLHPGDVDCNMCGLCMYFFRVCIILSPSGSGFNL